MSGKTVMVGNVERVIFRTYQSCTISNLEDVVNEDLRALKQDLIIIDIKLIRLAEKWIEWVATIVLIEKKGEEQ